MTLVELREKEKQIERDLQDGIDCSKGDMTLNQLFQVYMGTKKLYHNLIYPALELAVDSDMIRKNPAKDSKKGVGGTRKERTAMTIAEQEEMLGFV